MVKRCIILGILLLAGTLGIIAWRAFTFPSRQIDVSPAPPLKIDLTSSAARLARAITFKTISHDDPVDFDKHAFEGLHIFLGQAFPRVHAQLEKETVGGWSLLYTWTGSDDSLKPIVLMGHLDVVPVVAGTEGDWVQDPFGGVIVDGMLYGRGTLDDKGSVMAILEAAELLLAESVRPKRTIYFAFGHDEETGGFNGATAIAALLSSRGVEAEFVLDEGGAVVSGAFPGLDVPVATVGVAEKGYLSVELSVETEGGHSSRPPDETAIGILSGAIHRLETRQMSGGLGPLVKNMLNHIGPEMDFGMRAVLANRWLFSPLVESQLGNSPMMSAFLRTTTAPTIFTAGEKDNVLPPGATATVNFRILPGETREDIVEHVTKVVNDDRVKIRPLMEAGNDPTKVSPSEGWAFETIAQSIREVLPEVVVSPYLVLASTDARHYEMISGNIYRYSPMEVGTEDLARIHGTNERLSLENYGRMIHFYHRLIQNAAL